MSSLTLDKIYQLLLKCFSNINGYPKITTLNKNSINFLLFNLYTERKSSMSDEDVEIVTVRQSDGDDLNT